LKETTCWVERTIQMVNYRLISLALTRQRVKKIYPFAERITECWRSITHNSGSAHCCTYQPHYTYNINIPVRHNEPESIDNIRGALHYLAKEEQKDGLCAYGCSEVPERPAAGRPRKLQK
ncbi:hypothetical protein LXO25_25210, partial [Escherichia coli]|nr:hypothetical protein [Escherichia coli]MCG2952474.1 hypothetical protein [Escherichia coli]MDQ1822996.1 hypothetical protein [Escherichia coli O25b:H4-ST131]MDW4618142.1 hypothetical protein [Escherichia coli]